MLLPLPLKAGAGVVEVSRRARSADLLTWYHEGAPWRRAESGGTEMRYSQYLLPTLKEIPSEAEVPSHQLMLRAGMIRKLASGIYSYLPLGLRSLRKVETIIREEMNRASAIELLLPFVPPAEL